MNDKKFDRNRSKILKEYFEEKKKSQHPRDESDYDEIYEQMIKNPASHSKMESEIKKSILNQGQNRKRSNDPVALLRPHGKKRKSSQLVRPAELITSLKNLHFAILKHEHELAHKPMTEISNAIMELIKPHKMNQPIKDSVREKLTLLDSKTQEDPLSELKNLIDKNKQLLHRVLFD